MRQTVQKIKWMIAMEQETIYRDIILSFSIWCMIYYSATETLRQALHLRHAMSIRFMKLYGLIYSTVHCTVFFCNLFYCYHFTFTWIFPIEKKTSPFETIANSKLNGFSICQNQNIAFEWIHAWQITCESYSFVILKQTYRCWGEGGSTRIFCSHTKWK